MDVVSVMNSKANNTLLSSTTVQTTTQCIITADDLGYAEIRDRGIFQCIEAGTITAVSLLVNGKNAKNAIEKAILYPHVSIGLHVNLTEGISVSSSSLVKSLFLQNDNNEIDTFRGKIGFRDALIQKKINLDEVRTEIRAQIAKFQELHPYHQLPTHADGHQHIHVLPSIREIFAEEIVNAQIKNIRLPILSEYEKRHLPLDRATFYQQVSIDAEISQSLFKKHNLNVSSVFLGFTLGGEACTLSNIFTALTSISNTNYSTTTNIIELMLHPGFSIPNNTTKEEAGCGNGPDDFSISKDREIELQLLLDSTFIQQLSMYKIQLISWKDIV